MDSKSNIIILDKGRGFELVDQFGNNFKLSDYKGKKVLISSHPLAWTSVCAEQMTLLDTYLPQFEELNTIAVGLSVDSSFTKKAWGENLGIKKLRMLADFWPHGGVSEMLKIFREKDGFSERANILIDEDRKVVFVKIYPIEKVPDFEEILSIVK